ncbi:MAG: thermonuclease family protein [Calothrix sp. C42_A2020_038]|nr:thermonuclease family protein [Calothrix sp. C42_A2020_038]
MTTKKTLILLCLCLLVSVVGCQPQKKVEIPIQVKVVRVVSGQSLEVLGMGEQPNLISQVRLIGIDAPDLRQRPWGDNSKENLEALIAQQPVNLEFDIEVRDKIGRTLAYVWKDKILLNEQMIKDGHALYVPRSPNHKYDFQLERAQQWARLMGLGIWNPETPLRVSPAEFRRINR